MHYTAAPVIDKDDAPPSAVPNDASGVKGDVSLSKKIAFQIPLGLDPGCPLIIAAFRISTGGRLLQPRECCDLNLHCQLVFASGRGRLDLGRRSIVTLNQRDLDLVLW